MKLARYKSLFGFFLLATFFGLFLRLVLVESYHVRSDSMAPTLQTGDLVFVWKWAFNLRLPFSDYEVVRIRKAKVGEVVAFTLPDRSGVTYLKRVAAVGGETLSFQDGKLMVDGVVRDLKGSTATIPDYGPVQVPDDSFFALGDNRADSIDSRVWGPIPSHCLKGKVSVVWLSLSPGGGIRSERLGINVD